MVKRLTFRKHNKSNLYRKLSRTKKLRGGSPPIYESASQTSGFRRQTAVTKRTGPKPQTEEVGIVPIFESVPPPRPTAP